MNFNKEKFQERVKVLLKEQGKEHLMEFAEEIAEIGWEVIKVAAECTEGFMLDDMITSSMDSTVKKLLDKIDGKEG